MLYIKRKSYLKDMNLSYVVVQAYSCVYYH